MVAVAAAAAAAAGMEIQFWGCNPRDHNNHSFLVVAIDGRLWSHGPWPSDVFCDTKTRTL